ncbi:patatin-like phospholipase family protein [Methylosinus sp. Sm6]|uniref:patatin-like phospholipase family protein n=1 Tax=Methylosinus sp. Sm6 TaxID=2866948 RepID=UPI001C998847|nr:patatin-like phospholipase family protein [Methylosinus sp. Sm6]MBY6241691.1 patatin-like phospholipase family protein [Methylosinus sp. Sm6]
MHELSKQEFQIGLTMSGAISAGAYTAGVVDFLIEALEAWEKAREANTDGTVPNHRVGIKVMSGASAGAITAAIGAIALVDEAKAGSFTHDGFVYRYTLPKLYEAWVVKPTLDAGDPKIQDFLSLDDIEARPPETEDFSRTSRTPYPAKNDPLPVVSLLNSRLLDDIAAGAISVGEVRGPRPYVSATLHVYLTLSNLRGVPWSLRFDGGDYHMISHGDRAHFVLQGAGAWATSSDFADNDTSRAELDLATIPDPANRNGWKDYAVCALGSSAFPVGLAPRLIDAPLPQDYAGRRYPNSDIAGLNNLAPQWPPAVVKETPFWFTCADGGIIDNDPFEYARFTLKKKATDQRILFDLHKADRAVVMISPFPEPKPIRNEGEPAMDIVSLFRSLMPSLIDQARFKPSELALAVDPDHGSRYLIGPRRVVDGKPQRYGIASGLLGGFGGFVARAFRDHDYQLGRRNCQKFLMTAFAVPADHPIVTSWPQQLDKTPLEALPEASDRADAISYCLVPLYGSAKETVALPPWPQIAQADLDRLMERIGARFDRIAPLLVQQNVRGVLGLLLGFVLLPGVRNLPGLIKDKALSFTRLAILSDLVRRDQIRGWELPGDIGVDPDDARLVIGELLDPAYDERNVEGIRKAAAPMSQMLDAAAIERVLDRLKTARGKPYQVWEAPWRDKDGGRLYTLVSRRPDIVSRALIQLGVGFFKPTVDAPGI